MCATAVSSLLHESCVESGEHLQRFRGPRVRQWKNGEMIGKCAASGEEERTKFAELEYFCGVGKVRNFCEVYSRLVIVYEVHSIVHGLVRSAISSDANSSAEVCLCNIQSPRVGWPKTITRLFDATQAARRGKLGAAEKASCVTQAEQVSRQICVWPAQRLLWVDGNERANTTQHSGLSHNLINSVNDPV